VAADDIAAIGGDAGGVVGVGQASAQGAMEGVGVGDLDGAVVFEQGIDGLSEVEGVGAENRAFAQGGGFHHVRATHGDEASADEDGAGGQAVEFSQVAHGIAEDDLGRGFGGDVIGSGAIGVLDSAVAEVGQAGAFDQGGDFVESFGFSGDDHEAQVGQGGVGDQAAVDVEGEGFFAGAGTAGDPQRNGVFVEAELGGEGVGAVDAVGQFGGVVFQGGDDPDTVGGAAEVNEALGVFVGLGQDAGDVAEQAASERADQAIAGEAAVADAAVGDEDGDVALVGLADEVGPDFEFHQDDGVGAEVVQGAADDAGQVEGVVEDGVAVGVEFCGAGEAGVGGGGDDDFAIRSPLVEGVDEGACGVDLADTDGVDPDAGVGGALAAEAAESLGPAGAIAPVGDDTVEQFRANGGDGHQVQTVDQVFHGIFRG